MPPNKKLPHLGAELDRALNVTKEDELSEAIHALRAALNKELNDLLIFSEVSIPVLDIHADELDDSALKEPKKKRRFNVPSIEGESFASREPRDVAKLLRRFIEKDLAANLLLAAISRTESTLNDILRLLLSYDNSRLKIGSAGGDNSDLDVCLADILSAVNKRALIKNLIERRLNMVFSGKPVKYFKYMKEVAKAPLTQENIDAFREAKATRDLIVHNDGVVNATYLGKAGQLCRAQDGEKIVTDMVYLSKCIQVFKKTVYELSVGIEKQTGKVKANE